MVLYYAFGGGLGHLTRASAVLYTFGYHENDFLVVTSSPFANIVFKEKNFIYIPDDFNTKPAELCSRIESIIQEFQINVFYVDSFPLGLIGEFIHMKVKKCVIRYIARLLKWNNYVSCLSNFYFRFEETFIIEPLPDVQMDYIIRNSENYKYISLKYPSSENKSDVNQILSKISSPVWLIVHSGNMDEINILQNFAAEIADIEHTKPEYLVVSQTDYKSDSNSQCYQISFRPWKYFCRSN